MTGACAAMLPGRPDVPGDGRLHLQHGPIDLVIGADGDRDAAFEAARTRFATVLAELVSELPLLRRHVGERPSGSIARRMHDAVRPHANSGFISPMAAVAGSVAEEVLEAMVKAAVLERAYVNNGGDIALYLGEGQSYSIAIRDPANRSLGRVQVEARDPVRGIATSGQGGRSFSLGIADAVTVLAATGSQADAAATLIANAVDLPGHPAISRQPACSIQPDSDLGDLPVTTRVGLLRRSECRIALDAGAAVARNLVQENHAVAAALFLRGEAISVGRTACLTELC